ncbi:hypothetical protein ACFOGJ_16255 [Marinibaculum pumilum]|uniref:Mobilization protein n=1 Tax=Marinibaculum pumilum TaxID=1766165 RepID=A0ABV7L2E9_9PROT
MTEDHEARQMASAARQQIQSHEERCAERWTEARDQLKTLNGRWWWLLTSIIAAGSTIAGGFFVLWQDLQQTLATIQVTLALLQRATGG